MVQLTKNSPRGNKTSPSNNGRNPRGGNNRSPFNKSGNQSPFNKGGNRSFNKGGNRSPFNQSGNNASFNNKRPRVQNEADRYPAKQQKVEEEETSSESEEELVTSLNSTQNKVNENAEETSDENASSESDEEIETQVTNAQNQDVEETSSEDEEDMETNANDEDESSEGDEEEVTENSGNDTRATAVEDGKEIKGAPRSDSTIYVSFLPLSTTKAQMETFFQRYGKIKSLEVDFSKKKDNKYAVIEFDTPELAQRALETNGLLYKNQHLSVRLQSKECDANKSIFLPAIPKDITRDDIWCVFEQKCGVVSKVFNPPNSPFFFVEFEHTESQQLALAMESITCKGKELQIQQYRSKPPSRGGYKGRSPYKPPRFGFKGPPKFGFKGPQKFGFKGPRKGFSPRKFLQSAPRRNF